MNCFPLVSQCRAHIPTLQFLNILGNALLIVWRGDVHTVACEGSEDESEELVLFQLSHGSQGLNSGHQVCKASTGPSCQPSELVQKYRMISHHQFSITVNLAKFQCVVFTTVLNGCNGRFSSCFLMDTNITELITLGVLSEHHYKCKAVVQFLEGKECRRFKFKMLME